MMVMAPPALESSSENASSFCRAGRKWRTDCAGPLCGGSRYARHLRAVTGRNECWLRDLVTCDPQPVRSTRRVRSAQVCRRPALAVSVLLGVVVGVDEGLQQVDGADADDGRGRPDLERGGVDVAAASGRSGWPPRSMRDTTVSQSPTMTLISRLEIITMSMGPRTTSVRMVSLGLAMGSWPMTWPARTGTCRPPAPGSAQLQRQLRPAAGEDQVGQGADQGSWRLKGWPSRMAENSRCRE